MSNKKYKLTDGNYWEASGIYDLDKNKTQREINSDLSDALNDEIIVVKITSFSGSLVRIPSSGVNAKINEDLTILGYYFSIPENITSNITVQFFNDTGGGYLTVDGTTVGSTAIELRLGQQRNTSNTTITV